MRSVECRVDYSMSNISHVITLSCDHILYFDEPSPVVGDSLWCRKCDSVSVVITAPAEFRMRCQKCGYARRFGRAKLDAEIAAQRHRMKHPSHAVLIFDGHRIIDRYRIVTQDALDTG